MMYQRASDKYFENQVLTATPQRLRVMLIDGALHYARRAAYHWEQGRNYEAGEAIVGCQRIVTELLRGLRVDIAPDLVANVAALYNFVFRRLIEAGLKRDPHKLADAVRVLEIDRETWRQLCEGLGTTPETAEHSPSKRSPHFDVQPETSGGFTIEV